MASSKQHLGQKRATQSDRRSVHVQVGFMHIFTFILIFLILSFLPTRCNSFGISPFESERRLNLRTISEQTKQRFIVPLTLNLSLNQTLTLTLTLIFFSSSLLPSSSFLLPPSSSLLPSSSFLLPPSSFFFLLPPSFFLLPPSSFLPPSFFLLPSTSSLLPPSS